MGWCPRAAYAWSSWGMILVSGSTAAPRRKHHELIARVNNNSRGTTSDSLHHLRYGRQRHRPPFFYQQRPYQFGPSPLHDVKGGSAHEKGSPGPLRRMRSANQWRALSHERTCTFQAFGLWSELPIMVISTQPEVQGGQLSLAMRRGVDGRLQAIGSERVCSCHAKSA